MTEEQVTTGVQVENQRREDLNLPIPDGALGVISFDITKDYPTDVRTTVEAIWFQDRLLIKEPGVSDTIHGQIFSSLDEVLAYLESINRHPAHRSCISSEFRIHTPEMDAVDYLHY